jgi:hypothetical protein
VISRGGLSHHGMFLLFKQSRLLFWKTLLLECRVCSSKSFVLFWKLLLRVESLEAISYVFCSGDGWNGWNTWWVAGRFGNCNRESHTSDTVSLLGSASAHRRPCVDGFILHVRKLSAHCCSLQCLCSMSLCTRAHPENCLLACLCAETLWTCPSEEEEEEEETPAAAATERRERRTVVSAVLSVAPAEKFASAATADAWCVQMTGATKLAAATFLHLWNQHPCCWWWVQQHIDDECGWAVRCAWGRYEATSTKFSRKLSQEFATGGISSLFLGFGTLFLLLWTGVYV